MNFFDDLKCKVLAGKLKPAQAADGRFGILTSISGPSKPILSQTGTDLHPTRSVRRASGFVLTPYA